MSEIEGEDLIEMNGSKNSGKEVMEKSNAGKGTCAFSVMDRLDEDEGRDCLVCGGSHSVTMDFVHGILVCEDCGAVVPLVDLVTAIGFSEQGQPLGHLVDAKDSGLDVSMLTMRNDAAKRAIKRSRDYNPTVRLREMLRAQSVQLGLSKPVLAEAELYMERLSNAVKGTWKRSVLVGAALYISIRQNRIPLTLLDLTSVTGIRIYTLGKYYCQALQILSMDVPPVDSRILLPKGIQRFMEQVEDVKIVDSCDASLCEDAELALGYILQNDAGSVHPLTSVGAAVVMAIEMNNMKVGMGQIAQVMSVSESALRKKVRTVKKNLLAYAPLLPFQANINHSNVSSYARTLIKITMLPRSTPETTTRIAQGGEGDAVPKQIMADAHAGGIRDSIKMRKVSETCARKKKIDTKRAVLMRPAPLPQGNQDTLAGEKHRLKETGSAQLKPLGVGDNEKSQIDLDTMYDETEMNACISDSELDQYIRSPEEVRLYEKLYDAQNL